MDGSRLGTRLRSGLGRAPVQLESARDGDLKPDAQRIARTDDRSDTVIGAGRRHQPEWEHVDHISLRIECSVDESLNGTNGWLKADSMPTATTTGNSSHFGRHIRR